MREVSESEGLRTFLDRRLVRALGHPLREHILAVLNERAASGTEIGEEIGADVSSFYHHLKELERLGCIEKVETRQRRGSKEHVFRAKRAVFFDDEAWEKLPPSVRADVTVSFVQQIFDRAVASIDAGTFGGKDEEHVSWVALRLDRTGWSEVAALLERALRDVRDLQRQSSARIAAGATEEKVATVAMLAFETPDRGDAGSSPPAPSPG